LSFIRVDIGGTAESSNGKQEKENYFEGSRKHNESGIIFPALLKKSQDAQVVFVL
jgi:hypothetical protein